MSDGSPTNLPDFLNDNPGVVGAAAGYAVNRGVQTANRNIAQLKKELGSIQRELTKEREAGEREQKNRERVFQISIELDHLLRREFSPDLLLRVAKLRDKLAQLRLSSSSFRSLQDKEFFTTTSSKLESARNAIAQSLSQETLDQIRALTQWNGVGESCTELFVTEQRLAKTTAELKAASSELQRVRDANTGFMHLVFGGNTRLTFLAVVTGSLLLISAVVAAIAVAKSSAKDASKEVQVTAQMIRDGWTPSVTKDAEEESSKILARGMLACIVALGLAAIPGALCFHNCMLLQHTQSTESKRLGSLEDKLAQQNSSLTHIKDHLHQIILSADSVPEELRTYLVDSTVPEKDRSVKVEEVKHYAASLKAYLAVGDDALPTPS